MNSCKNPIAGARFFNFMIKKFFDVILRVNDANHSGVIGKLSAYYGVVEAQGRGSLHIHMLIWIEEATSLLNMKEKDYPAETTLDENAIKYGKPAMSPPQHEHSATCYKHLPKALQLIKDPNLDCRFNQFFEKNTETHFDEDSRLHIPSISDIKFIGSGTAAEAMYEYITNYIAKRSLDSAVMFSASPAAIASITHQMKDGTLITDEPDECARSFMIKSVMQ
ncbi:hypothetical protein HK098_004637 [Nowakowskiella sp. JEL0407]|nr:hypothetical protein HK098_004637 [Nowakowskiella sp. JEL0407]